jgi:hypothetical protein
MFFHSSSNALLLFLRFFPGIAKMIVLTDVRKIRKLKQKRENEKKQKGWEFIEASRKTDIFDSIYEKKCK